MDKLYELVEKHWIERTGLLALIGISWGVEFNILEAFEIDKIYYSIPFILTPVLCYFPWHINRRYSKTPPGKLGIVVSISCLNSEDYSRVREDFTLTLRQLIKSGRLSEDFFFIEIPQYHAQNIVETEDAKKVLDACAGSRYFCESFYGHPCPTSGKNYATAPACGGPSRPGHSFATQQGVAHLLSNDSTRCRKACIFTTLKLRENTCTIASGDYSTPVSQRMQSSCYGGGLESGTIKIFLT